MKAVRMGDKVGFYPGGLTCRHCHRAIKRGQVALTADMPNNPITDRIFAVHATPCMADLVASAPADHDELSFIALRQRIAATGHAFPD